MNIIRRLLIVSGLALLLPFTALQASAAEVPLAAAPSLPGTASIMGGTVVADTGLAADRIAQEAKLVKTARRWRRGRRLGGLAAGLIIGGAAAAILSHSARARDRRYYRRRRGRCERWYYRCEDGSRRACRKFYRYCD